jgi:integrase
VRVWVAQWWENGCRRTQVLGRVGAMTPVEAQLALTEILRPINEGRIGAPKVPYTFGRFLEDVYLPHCRRTWKASTAYTSEHTVKVHVLPEFENRLLTSVTRTDMQDLLEAKAKKLAKSVVAHIRWYLNALFKLAVSDGLVGSNPAAELRIPNRCKAGRNIRALTEEEVNQLLDALEPRERLIARLAIFEGLRPGEILALRWGSFDGEAMRIRERVYEGKIDTPKSGKPRESALSDGTLSALQAWRALATSVDPDAFVFPSENPNTPISRRNIWARRFSPALEKVGLEWATFQALRKTNATLSRKVGVDAKVSADQRGHGLGVSMEVYTTSDRQQKREAVNKLESAVALKRKPKLPENA